MMDPWERIRQDWPAVFTATTAALVASAIFQTKDFVDVTHLEFWKMLLSVLVSVGISLIIVYFFVYLVIHKLRHKIQKEGEHLRKGNHK